MPNLGILYPLVVVIDLRLVILLLSSISWERFSTRVFLILVQLPMAAWAFLVVLALSLLTLARVDFHCVPRFAGVVGRRKIHVAIDVLVLKLDVHRPGDKVRFAGDDVRNDPGALAVGRRLVAQWGRLVKRRIFQHHLLALNLHSLAAVLH